jgi:type I restriction enzyme S subunit
MKILKPKNESVNLRFVFEIMQAIKFQLGDHKRYWISEYCKLEVVIPPAEEQTAIATVLSDMDAEITTLEARRDKSRAIKQGMMQELLTGRIRLNHDFS